MSTLIRSSALSVAAFIARRRDADSDAADSSSAEKIRVAISIIDHFKNKLDELDNNEEVDTISKDVLEMINREYRNFALQKINMHKLY